MGTTDGDLIEAVKDWRDDASWQIFHDRYAGLIIGHAIKSGLRLEDAEEVLQNTMIKLARALPGFTHDRKVCRFRTWLNQIINQRIVDHYRRSRKRLDLQVSLESLEIDPPDWRPEGVDPVAQAETERGMLEASLARLRNEVRPEHWQLFEAYALRGMKADEVAKLFRVSVSKVRMTRLRIVRILKSHWNELMEQPFSGNGEG